MAPLLTIETSRLRLTWSGPVSAQVGREPTAVWAGGERGEHAVWLEEEVAYPVLLQSLDGSPVELWHRDPVVTSGLVSVDGGTVVHGRIRFGSQAGRARFDVLAGGDLEARLESTVLPTKLAEAEVHAMRSAVEAHAAGLAVAALRPASVGTGNGRDGPSVPVWLASLGASLTTLDAALREINRRPELGLRRAVEGVPSAQIRRPSSETRRHAARHGVRAVMPARPAHATADTPAHRWVAAQLAASSHRLRALVRDEAGRAPSARRSAIVQDLERLAGRLESLRSTPVLLGASGPAPDVPPLVLRRRPVYASVFDALRRLDHGMDLRDGGLDVAVQDLAVVFETWAALAVVETVAEALGVDVPRHPFGVEARGTDVRLRRGWRHAVRLEAGSVRVEIAYNPRFPSPPALLSQRPDLVLTVTRRGQARRVVLDAKYRRDDSAGYRRRFGASGPPEEALGTLHRYRDAIPGHIEVAAALFPGSPHDIGAARWWASLETQGVGAIPVRPGRLGALAEFIGRVL